MLRSIIVHINKWGVVFGFVYALVALGFYFTGPMILLLGLASLSTAVALQRVLFEGFQGHFAILGVLLVFETNILYLKRMGVANLTISSINYHRAFVGALVIMFAVTYLALFLLVSFSLRTQ